MATDANRYSVNQMVNKNNLLKTGYLKWIARYIADCPKERNEGHFSKKLISFFEKFRQLRSCVRGQFQEQYDGGMI